MGDRAKSPTQLVRAVLAAAARFRDQDWTRDPSGVIGALDAAVDEYRAWLNSLHPSRRAGRVDRATRSAAKETPPTPSDPPGKEPQKP